MYDFLLAVSGQLVSPNAVVVNRTNQLIVLINNPMIGQWSAAFQTKANVTCLFVAQAITNLTVSSGFVVAAGGGLQSDNVTNYSQEFTPSYFVAHVNGITCPAQIMFLEIFEGFEIIGSATPSLRYNCAYETYFGPINCNRDREYNYKVYSRAYWNWYFIDVDGTYTYNCYFRCMALMKLGTVLKERILSLARVSFS